MLHLDTFMLIYVAVTGSQSGGDSLKTEMSQAGFSAAYVPGGNVITRNSMSNAVVHRHSLCTWKAHTLCTSIESRFWIYVVFSLSLGRCFVASTFSFSLNFRDFRWVLLVPTSGREAICNIQAEARRGALMSLQIWSLTVIWVWIWQW